MVYCTHVVCCKLNQEPDRKGVCHCKKGYVANSCDECVSEHKKDKPCKREDVKKCGCNEVFETCTNKYVDRTCENYEYLQAGKTVKLGKCDKCQYRQCVCKPGNYRHSVYHHCVPGNQCRAVYKRRPTVCCADPNEEYTDWYYDGIDKRCDGKKPDCFNKTKPISKGPGCKCIKGTLRNMFGKCVKKSDCKRISECTNPCSNHNEEYRCINLCIEQSCVAQVDIKFILPCTDSTCTWKCDCIKGYLRSRDGICRLKKFACDHKYDLAKKKPPNKIVDPPPPVEPKPEYAWGKYLNNSISLRRYFISRKINK